MAQGVFEAMTLILMRTSVQGQATALVAVALVRRDFDTQKSNHDIGP